MGLGAGRTVDVWIGGKGTAQLIIDVVGYFTPTPAAGATEFHPIAPARAYDSRTGSPSGPLAGGGPSRTTSAGPQGLPGTSIVPAQATAVAYNLTATGNSVTGYLAVGPDPATTPDVSSLNWSPALPTVANGSVVALGATPAP